MKRGARFGVPLVGVLCLALSGMAQAQDAEQSPFYVGPYIGLMGSAVLPRGPDGLDGFSPSSAPPGDAGDPGETGEAGEPGRPGQPKGCATCVTCRYG